MFEKFRLYNIQSLWMMGPLFSNNDHVYRILPNITAPPIEPPPAILWGDRGQFSLQTPFNRMKTGALVDIGRLCQRSCTNQLARSQLKKNTPTNICTGLKTLFLVPQGEKSPRHWRVDHFYQLNVNFSDPEDLKKTGIFSKLKFGWTFLSKSLV